MVNNGLDPKNIHLVGHSLGAHISAFACKRFTELTGLKVGRLTGLDPAGPCFSHVDDNLRLKETDADFVDAIHTDGGVHSRAVALFAESVTARDAFPALRCEDYDQFKKGQCSSDVSLMGLAAVNGTRGLFYLQTNEAEPYGAYKAGMKYVNRDGVVKNVFGCVSNDIWIRLCNESNVLTEDSNIKQTYYASSNVKKLIGVDYEEVEGASEPDLDSLSLDFICPSVARLLPATPGYDPKSELVMFMHGFTDNPDSTNFQTVNEAFQSIGHYNILALDASSLIRWLYLRSTTYVRFIGQRLGEALAAMVNNGLEPKNIHLVGHSLGAHIAAFACKQFTNLTGLKVGRLTGLDPAGPCFSQVDDNLRLNATDADFVDAIHTDGGVYGMNEATAQVDYFPNGGSQQPNCTSESCSHSRVVTLFADLMGLGAVSGTRGLFYLQTNGAEPYGAYKAGLKYVNRDGVVKNLFG
ncbi:putative lipase, partial [Operophtera brumata]